MNETNKISSSSLFSLQGRQLSAVVFVRDYIQFQYDGATLTVLIFPSLKVGSEIFNYGDVEYRNKMCEQINEEVTNVSTKNESEITIAFANDSKIIIPLEYEKAMLPELVIFQDEDGSMQVW